MAKEEIPGKPPRRVLDPTKDAAALKALTHPLRIRLLGLLRQHGPATASELAVRTGESSASTSYHLRVLAKYAFVTEAEHRDGRERRWRSVHAITSWSNSALGATSEGRAFMSFAHRRQLEHLQNTLVQNEADLAEGRLGPQWVEPSGISDSFSRLTPASLTELRRAFEAKLAELTARDDGAPGAEQVVIAVAALPLAPHGTRPGDAAGETDDSDGEGGDGGDPGSTAPALPDGAA
ncbi:ArsR/SmtB family transcription factor [Streptomyces sp. NPDC004111]|uniref:ArsR/SmtB family transcription factor n=1 Tax=Streptomyces sp. NPDC004111 TaxID=3364690 RepID=UPI0036A2F30D